MNYYLVIGVHRSPWCSEQDYNTYLPFHHEVISEKALTAEDLIKSFIKSIPCRGQIITILIFL